MTRIAAIATAVPAHEVSQTAALEGARHIFGGRRGDFGRLAPAFGNAGIDRRHSCVPIDWYFAPHGWADRNALYQTHALDLLETVALDCLRRAGRAPAEIDALVVVSSTGIATPSLDAMLMNRMDFRADTARLPIFGLGCAGGVLGLGRAAALARAQPGSRVLLLVVELCGLTFRSGDTGKSNVIATALFGDGAAAVLVEDGPGPATIDGWGDHLWPGSLDIMGWSVEDDGLGVLFSRDIPTLVRRDLIPAADAFLARQGLSRADLAGYVCHPGGAKVLDALRAALDLPAGALDAEAEVLRRHGNMSAPTALFVLARRLADGSSGRHLMLALGPGFTAGFAMLTL